ncbi:DUF4145 domain-containing protein [Acinetobacter nosocomialis]|uniref:DUF4145 domain-containing protein n=1 Tax=Acinetobacter nosocomialis TaxID=106654 RepID=UPI0013C37A60|nr:DUF4145 domain-containing protein [Acinetobacter nosocomialis]
MTNLQPEFKKGAFICPNCNVYANMEWLYTNQNDKNNPTITIYLARCFHCKYDSIWRIASFSNQSITTEMIYPRTEIIVKAEADMPEDVKADFEEAKQVYNASPKAAAALLRLALQKLLVHLGQPGKNINSEIGNLVAEGKLNGGIQKAADTVRLTGNNSVHPGEMNEEDIDFVASKMFDLINFIIKKTITEPRELEELYNMTPLKAREAIEKRDTK